MSRTIRAPKRKRAPSLTAQVAALIADVEALKTASNEMSARLAKVEVVKAGPQDPAAPPPTEPAPEESQKPETE